MNPDKARSVIYKTPADFENTRIIEFIAGNTASLLGIIRSYVHRMGLASGEEVQAVAMEVLQEVVLQALDHADRFNPKGQPMAWLLGIAINVIKRNKVELIKRAQRELSISDICLMQEEQLSESDRFDQLTADSSAGPDQEIAANEQAELLLSLVSPEDQHILMLAFLQGFDREALAQQLGISPGATRVRLHRALKRLRLAWGEKHLRSQEGESNE
ncbi:MAG TPA: sigma-70 family RNA polymerase sigma factor [Ktedonobacteraceae bacterium]|nr:sigma-70 family RNA polymerase sigma factor [Ktedonobacteraceae bacterium]